MTIDNKEIYKKWLIMATKKPAALTAGLCLINKNRLFFHNFKGFHVITLGYNNIVNARCVSAS
jgi:hypothetical protein